MKGTSVATSALLVTVTLVLGGCGGGASPSPGGGGDGGGGGGSHGQVRFSTTVETVGEAAGNTTLMIERANGSTGATSVTVTSTGGTATAGQDYTAVAMTINFADGDSAPKPVSLAINNDTSDEPDETVVLTLSNPTGGATLGGAQEITATVTIHDDDEPPTAPNLVTSPETKRLAFAWLNVANATSYKLLRRDPSATDFVQIGADLATGLTGTKFDIPVHLYQWDDAGPQYRLDACNVAGCTPSNVVSEVRALSAVATGYIKASDTSAGAQFGSAVAVSGDGKTVAIGAPFANGEAGDIYVYIAPVAGPVLAPNPIKISAPSTQAMHFGASVALSEDGNTLVVGAPFDNNAQTGVGTYPASPNANAVRSGGVFVYSRTGNTWSTPPVYIKATDADTGDEFGSAVAVRDTVIAVGAPRQDSPSSNDQDITNAAVDSGAVYAFVANAGTWIQAPEIIKAGIAAGNLFGSSVAVSRGGATLIVGAPNEDSNGMSDSGAAYRFVRTDAGAGIPTWSQPQRLPVGVNHPGDSYGDSVAVSATGDVLAIGAPNEDDLTTQATDVGGVYVITTSQGLLTDFAYLTATHRHASARFGASLAINEDGSLLAAGAPNESANEIGVDGLADAPLTVANSGAVDVFARQTGAKWSAQGDTAPRRHYIKAPNTGAQDVFGTAVGLSSDGNTLVVGASDEDGNGRNIDSQNNPADNSVGDSGAAYLF